MNRHINSACLLLWGGSINVRIQILSTEYEQKILFSACNGVETTKNEEQQREME
jgi:hypothetical protein